MTDERVTETIEIRKGTVEHSPERCRRLDTLRRRSDRRLFSRDGAVVRAAGGQGQLLRRGLVDDLRLEDALLFRAFVLGHDRLEVHEYTG